MFNQPTAAPLASNNRDVDHITLRSAPRDGGHRLYDEKVSAGKSLEVWAAAYNRDGDYLYDIDVVWELEDPTKGKINPASGHCTTFTGSQAGQTVLRAYDSGDNKEWAKITIHVQPGKLARIAIRDQPEGKGTDLTGQSVEVVIGTERSLWAAGYDAGGNYIGDQALKWLGTGDVASSLQAAVSQVTSVVIKPSSLGDGTIIAQPRRSVNRVSANVSFTMDDRCKIRIRNQPGGKGKPVGGYSMKPGDKIGLWAAGYDAAGSYFDDLEVRWTVSNLFGVEFPSGLSKNCTLVGAMSGRISATKRVIPAAGTVREIVGESATIEVISPTVGSPPKTGVWSKLCSWWRRIPWPAEVSQWTIIAWLIFAGTLLLSWPSLYTRLDDKLQPVAALWVALPFMVLCTLIAVLFTGSLSEPLYRYDQTRKFRERPGRSLAVLALTLFAIGMLLAFLVVFSVNSKDALIGPPGVSAQAMQALFEYNGSWHRLFKLGMTGILFLIPVVLAVSAGLMAARDYDLVAQRTHQTLVYMDVDELKAQALETASKELNLDGIPAVSRLKRTEDGGVLLTVHHRGEMIARGKRKVIEERTWDITADYAGRVTKIEPQALKLLEISVNGADIVD